MGRIASHSMELPAGATAPEWVQLLPYGTVSGRDGRGPYTLRDAAHAARVIAATTAYQRGADLPIDYDHQLLFVQQNGQPALASGWIKELAARADGLWGRVEWTAAAAARISGREYRYLSPVFRHAPDGTVSRIVAAALTNTPNLELTALASSALFHDNDEDLMNEELKKLLAALGLAETTTMEQLVAHCQGLKATVSAVTEASKTLAPAVGKAADAPPADIIAAASATLTGLAAVLKTEPTGEKLAAAAQAMAAGGTAATPDPAKYVPIGALKELQDQVAAMSQSLAADKASAAVAEAKKAGKISPAMEAWASEYAAKDLQGFTAWCSAAPAIVTPAGKSSTAKAPAAGDTHGLTDDELAVCSQLGLSAEDYAKSKKETA